MTYEEISTALNAKIEQIRPKGVLDSFYVKINGKKSEARLLLVEFQCLEASGKMLDGEGGSQREEVTLESGSKIVGGGFGESG